VLSWNGRASLWGSIAVSALFLVIAGVIWLWARRIERRAERFLSRDGQTLLIVGPHSVRVGDLEIPLERSTCVFANPALESYSDGGMRGERMAARLDLTENRPSIGRGIGVLAGNQQRRRMYRDGAKSGIEVAIGVERIATLGAPDGMINRLRTLPHRGEDPGRIDLPFGAYLGTGDLERFLQALSVVLQGRAPIAVATDTLTWAGLITSAAESRDRISAEVDAVLAKQAARG